MKKQIRIVNDKVLSLRLLFHMFSWELL